MPEKIKGYQPTPEEIKEAEETMSKDQVEMSKERERQEAAWEYFVKLNDKLRRNQSEERGPSLTDNEHRFFFEMSKYLASLPAENERSPWSSNPRKRTKE